MTKLLLAGFLLMTCTFGIQPDARASHLPAAVAGVCQEDPPPSPDKDAPPPKEIKPPGR